MAINFLNTAIGTSATFTGVVTLTDRLVLSDSLKNSFIGENTGVNNTTGDENIGLGYNSLFSNTTGGHNTAIGKYSLYSNISGSYNIAIGQQALYSSTSSSNNIGIGFLSLYTNLSGFANIGLGERSLEKNTTGAANIAIGPQALWNNTTGGNNSATGYWSLYANTTGNGNAAFGSNSLVSNTTGSDNVAMGIYSGKWIADGSTPNATSENSIFIGSNTRANANSETNQIVIGGDAIGNGSNTVTLGNDSIVKTILKGTITAPSYGAGTLVTDAAGNITTSSGGGAGGPFLPLAAGSGFPLTGALTGTSATFAGAITGSNLSGTNTGDQDLSGYVTLATAQTITGAKTIDTLKIGSANKIQFANNDFIRYEDATGVGRFHFDSDGGTNNSSVQAATFVGALSGNASSATTLQTARTIAGVSFDGSANISLNNNAITNGAGYITSASLPSVGNGTLTMTTSTGLDGGATFTANQSGNSAFAVTLDLTEITLSAGLDSTATGLSLDLSEFTDMTATMLTTDEFIVLDSGAERRKAAGEIGLSIFNNDVPFITSASLPTVNNATITIQAGTNLTTGGAFTTNQSFNETIVINMATGGAGAGFYGSTSNSIKIDQITLDAYGRVTAVSTGATGQVNTVATGNSSTLTSSGTTAKTLTPVTAAVSSGSANLATGAQIQTAINTALVGVLSYQGTWNASTNSPTLSSGSGTAGYYYIVSVAGSTNLDGITDWAVGDWAVFSDQATDAWQKIDNTAVGSMSSFIIKEGNGTETSTVTNGETITFAQGTGIQSELTSTSSGGTLTITNTSPNIVQTTVSGNAGSVTNGVYTIGTQSIGGAKTFTTTPISVTRSTADSSTYLATTAFVKNQGYTSNVGDITGVTAGNKLTGGGTSGTVTLGLASNNISQWTNDSGYTTNVGDITAVTAGTGLSGGGSSGAVTLTLDLGELAVGGTLIATDYLIAENGGVDNRQLISSIPLSIFSNNAGWTSNSGDITGVTAGSGISGGGTSGTVTITNSAPNIVQTTISGNAYSATVLQTARTIAGVSFNGSANISLNNNAITNGAGYTGNVGDITGVTAGTGITGGGTSGTVTISHADTSSQATVNNSGNTYIQDVTLDTFGHVTGLVSSTTTLGGLGFTGATNANYITNNNQLSNGAGYTTNTGTVTGTVSASESINTIAQRNSSGYLFASYFNGSGTFSTTGASSGMGLFTGTNGTDTYGRSYTAAAARTLLNVANGATNVTNNNQLTNGAGYVTSSGNTTIGTSTNIGVSTGGAVLSSVNLTQGVITSFATRTMTLANLGYTGATNANYITNNNQLANGAGYTTSVGDITNVSAGSGLTGGGSSGSVTLNVDYAGSDSIVMAAPGGSTPDGDDYMIYGSDSSSDGSSLKTQFVDLPLSIFDNDAGFKSSAVTSIATTSPILGGTITSTGTLSLKVPVSGAWHNGGVAIVGAVTEVGRYIDFHTSNTGTSDYDVRMDANGTELLISGNVRASGNLEAVGNIVAGYVRSTGGSAYQPAHSFNSDTNTGMFNPAADTLQFSTGGAYRWSTNNYATIINQDCGIGVTPLAKFHVNGVSIVRSSTGVGDFFLGNNATANHFRFHTNNSDTYFDMNCGNVYWRDGGSIRYRFFPSTANMTINGTLTQNSDIRIKENIVEIDDCIGKVQAMRGVYYNRTDFNTGPTKVGVIAQEVEAVLPELILENEDDGLKSVAYSELTAVLINAIKEQQEIIEDLKTRVEQLEK